MWKMTLAAQTITYKADSVCLSVSLLLLHGHNFLRFWIKIWYVAFLQHQDSHDRVLQRDCTTPECAIATSSFLALRQQQQQRASVA